LYIIRRVKQYQKKKKNRKKTIDKFPFLCYRLNSKNIRELQPSEPNKLLLN
jgi:hypothetical protein